MKLRLLQMMCWLPMLVACSATTPSNGGETPTAPVVATAAVVDAGSLATHHWRLQRAMDREGRRIDALFVRADLPVQLDFNEGRLAVLNACNRIGGSFEIENDRLIVGAMISTKMACADPALTNLDRAISERLQGSLRIEFSADTPPRLRLLTEGGDTLEFIGEPTDATRYGGEGETVFLEIDARMHACNHPLIPAARCLRVRERHYDVNGLKVGEPGEWQLLYQDIAGYTHEDGVRNVLRVKRYVVKNPPADAPATALVLDMVVESERVESR
ncbi:MAG: Heat shock protein HslJ [Alphaproteobacteria bacterium ADurb.BinA280]|jgi:heat shock protein HslJ|uniref:META and DUF4377 domain-containing protein n=1 Tax=Dokdonella sp. TaxID=2291710 RepID=UPI0009CE1CC7|nr:META and DUF4377 domain-containing protein [Dokdonella sp.]MCC6439472.1 META and DUF4377 domain-containing protein [Rhodanobacteraceae bacterium]OPZ09577.1 MAG: Heat shock protein HslJ [Alphaproteobacteria bacterium ADurb.BinA280]MBK8123255.1 META and DUF4377 domain-containing protein [Dokdonella sp.]MBP6327209.1 META and DUF4377 domain-containing protein [Dokdonella sp.]MBP6329212.1 META and DUF4377 domain-containing protein [Dokdonella sp.]